MQRSRNYSFSRLIADMSDRYTISTLLRREVLDRLLQLNHERYAEEVAAGLHDKGKKGKANSSKKTKNKSSPGQIDLL